MRKDFCDSCGKEITGDFFKLANGEKIAGSLRFNDTRMCPQDVFSAQFRLRKNKKYFAVNVHSELEFCGIDCFVKFATTLSQTK